MVHAVHTLMIRLGSLLLNLTDWAFSGGWPVTVLTPIFSSFQKFFVKTFQEECYVEFCQPSQSD